MVTALLVTLSPAFGVYAAWAASFLSPYALTLCLTAGLWLEGSPSERFPFWARCLGAVILILIACTIWQAAAPMALFMGFASAWRRRGVNEGGKFLLFLPGVLTPLLVLGASAAFYLIAHHFAVNLGWLSANGSERMALAADPVAKLGLLGDLLRSGFTSWARFHPAVWQVLASALFVGGCGLAMLRRDDAGHFDWPALARRGVLMVAMIPASVSPLLVAGENNAAYRALPVLYATVIFLTLEGYHYLLARRTSRARFVAGCALVAIAAGGAFYHVRIGIVEPNAREYAGVRREVRRQFRQMPARVVYLLPPAVLLANGRLIPSWEYGVVSSTFWWVTKPFLILIFHDLRMEPANPAQPLEIHYREAGNPSLPVLNPMSEMRRETGTWRVDPRWGHVLAFSDGWLYSPWLGYLNVKEFPIVQHHILGPLLNVGAKPDDLWFYREGLGIFYTTADSFPSLYLTESKEWVFLSDDDPAHRTLVDMTGRKRALAEPGQTVSGH